jgi:programmed cell death 6-interacting protein
MIAIDTADPVLLAEAARLEREFPMQKIEAAQFEDLFEKRLRRYDDELTMVRDEKEDQEQLIAQLREAYNAFNASKQGQESNRSREQALQRLENAYLKFKEILGNLDSARKFYNDLARIVNGFREECQQFRYSRRVEAGQLEG